MRYDAEHKLRTRDKVVKAAAKAIRAKGPDGIGIADVMADVGLTHGGFYAHFASNSSASMRTSASPRLTRWLWRTSTSATRPRTFGAMTELSACT